MSRPDFAVVVPTIGRPALGGLLAALAASSGSWPTELVVVDDRRGPDRPLPVVLPASVSVVRSGGRGPAAARNAGWRATTARWVCFLDDDVLPQPDWLVALAEDLRVAEALQAVGSQGIVAVPCAARPTDDERRTARLADARWITADMAYRRSALTAVGGFDERFPRAYREDSDLALRIVSGGQRIVRGARRCIHPVAAPALMGSVRAQIGNRDDVLLRRKHGHDWRVAIGEGPGRLPAHLATTGAALAAVGAGLLRRRWAARVGALIWAACTAQFWSRRYRPGPRTLAEAARLALTSVLIPPVAVWHRLAGEWTHRRARRDPPLAVLLDRDDTIIDDVPYLADPNGVRPRPDAARALKRLRDRGLLLAVVTNQSGVARGLIDAEQLASVNARVDAALGPFDAWQICPHAEDDGCRCRKPRPGMVLAAAEALGVPPHRCVMIGDTGGDVDAALSAGAAAVLVPTARTRPVEVEEARERARVAPTLDAAVSLVLRECR